MKTLLAPTVTTNLIGDDATLRVGRIQVVAAEDIWAFKRAQQARDRENVNSGKYTNEQMSWFSGGKAKQAKLINSPY